MKWIKLYEEFRIEELVEPETEISDVDDIKEEDSDVYQDINGVYHIKNWTVY